MPDTLDTTTLSRREIALVLEKMRLSIAALLTSNNCSSPYVRIDQVDMSSGDGVLQGLIWGFTTGVYRGNTDEAFITAAETIAETCNKHHCSSDELRRSKAVSHEDGIHGHGELNTESGLLVVVAGLPSPAASKELAKFILSGLQLQIELRQFQPQS